MSEYKADFQKTIEEAFLLYSGMVLQDRAMVDVRDCLKVGARQGMYAQYIEKITHDKPYKKAIKSVSAGMNHFYVRGDTSLYGTLIRMGKPFVFRYPLQDVQGNFGTPMAGDNHGASRYLEMRLSETGGLLFSGIKKNAIEKWRWNYDDTEQYPSVLPSPFFYNIVNGTMGIGVGASASIPQFNLKEVNDALITLIKNPNATFEELYCPIDFATGATIINEEQVKESLKFGRGKSAVIRATIEYDARKHMLIVTEMPYSTYTENVCGQIGELLEEEPTCGIDGVLDATTETPRIEIKLSKKANPEQVKNVLYAKTSLQSYYTINMTMLEMGKRPKVFGWREALLAKLAHTQECVRREKEFDLETAKARLHIVEGLLIAIEHIDEFIAIIRGSESTAEASHIMRERYGLSELQAKATLDIRLARLVNLEYIKVEKEEKQLHETIADITDLLSNKNRFDQMLIDGFNAVSISFGDARRTKNMNVAKEIEEQKVEITHEEEKNVKITLTNKGALRLEDGKKKLSLPSSATEFIIDQTYGSRSQSLLIFTKNGVAYTIDLNKLDVSTNYNCYSLLEMPSSDKVSFMLHSDDFANYPYLFTATQSGMLKKTDIKEFVTKKKSGLAVMKLKDGDRFTAACLIHKDTSEIVLLSDKGYVARFSLTEISSTGRLTQGVKSIKLGPNDALIQVFPITKEQTDHYLLTITREGYLKKTLLSDISLTSRSVKGALLQKFESDDAIAKGTVSAGSSDILLGGGGTSTLVKNEKFELTPRGKEVQSHIIIRAGVIPDYLAEVIQ